MKKLILALCLLLMVSVGAAGEEMQTETAPTVAEIALTMRPESEEPTHLTVGNSTKVSGSFFTTQFGNNTSAIDVRYMLHGYNPIVWMNSLNSRPIRWSWIRWNPLIRERAEPTPSALWTA